MSRLPLYVVVAISTACVPSLVAAADGEHRSACAVVVDTMAGSVVLADPLAGTLAATMGAGEAPTDVVVRGSIAYVTGAQSLAAIDLAGRSVLKTTRLPEAGAIVFASGDQLYTASRRGAGLALVSTAGLRVEASAQVGPAPSDLAFDESGQRLFVAEAAGSVLIVDATSYRVERKIPLGESAFAEAIGFDSLGRRLYVAVQGVEPSDGTLVVIDPDRGQITARVRVGGTPRDVVLSSDARLAFVADTQLTPLADPYAALSETISVVDVEKQEVASVIPVAEYGRGPARLALTPDGEILLATTAGGDGLPATLIAISVQERRVVGVIAAGQTLAGVAGVAPELCRGHSSDLTPFTLLEQADARRRSNRFDEALALYARAASGADVPPIVAIRSLMGEAFIRLQRQQYDEATAAWQRALNLTKAHLGAKHWLVGLILNDLGLSAFGRQQWDAARDLFREAVAILEANVPADHPGLAGPYSNLAMAGIKASGVDAERYARQALAIWEHWLGKDHLHVAGSLETLAFLQHAGGNPQSAEKLLRRALAIREAHYGRDHPELLGTLANLVLVAVALGDLQMAEPLVARASDIARQVEGPSRRQLAGVLLNYAQLLDQRNRREEAERQLTLAFNLTEKEPGSNHPESIMILRKLAEVKASLGKDQEAAQLYERLLQTETPSRPPNEPPTGTGAQATAEQAAAHGNLGAMLAKQGRFDGAEKELEAAIAIFEKIGTDSADLALALNNLGQVRSLQGRYRDAEPLLRRALALRERLLGPGHPDVAVTLNGLAVSVANSGDPKSAVNLLERARAIHESRPNPDPVAPNGTTAMNSYGTTLAILGKLYSSIGDDARARPAFEQGIQLLEKAPDGDKLLLADALNSLGVSHHLAKELPQAERAYQHALQLLPNGGGNDILRSVVLQNLGEVNHNMGHLDRSQPYYEEALQIRERTLGPDHAMVAETLDYYAALLRDLNRAQEADRFSARARRIRGSR